MLLLLFRYNCCKYSPQNRLLKLLMILFCRISRKLNMYVRELLDIHSSMESKKNEIKIIGRMNDDGT